MLQFENLEKIAFSMNTKKDKFGAPTSGTVREWLSNVEEVAVRHVALSHRDLYRIKASGHHALRCKSTPTHFGEHHKTRLLQNACTLCHSFVCLVVMCGFCACTVRFTSNVLCRMHDAILRIRHVTNGFRACYVLVVADNLPFCGTHFF